MPKIKNVLPTRKYYGLPGENLGFLFPQVASLDSCCEDQGRRYLLDQREFLHHSAGLTHYPRYHSILLIILDIV